MCRSRKDCLNYDVKDTVNKKREGIMESISCLRRLEKNEFKHWWRDCLQNKRNSFSPELVVVLVYICLCVW